MRLTRNGISLKEINNLYEWEYQAYLSAAAAHEKEDMLKWKNYDEKTRESMLREIKHDLGFDFIADEKSRIKMTEEKLRAQAEDAEHSANNNKIKT